MSGWDKTKKQQLVTVNSFSCVGIVWFPCLTFTKLVVTRFCVVSFFIPATMANDLRLWRIFYPRFYPLHLFSYLNSWERASIFPFECSVINKDTTGTIFITSLVWCGPWLGIEPETSRTRSQHNTTRQSRRRSLKLMDFQIETCYIDMHAPNLNFETQIRWHVILCLIDEWKFTLTNADFYSILHPTFKHFQ